MLYDALGQLAATNRGNLVNGQNGKEIVDQVFAQDWSLDALGNWAEFQENSDGQGGLEIDQTRTGKSKRGRS